VSGEGGCESKNALSLCWAYTSLLVSLPQPRVSDARAYRFFLVRSAQVFAMCPVKEGAVERTVDSSRYFVLKIQNAQGQSVGMSSRQESRDSAMGILSFGCRNLEVRL
jgi:hypothetical protein